MIRVYVSGPITGHEETYRAEFAAAADRLRKNGFEPVNPATIEGGPEWTWDDYMHAAIELQRGCDGIYLLRGWKESRGATIEYYVAIALGQRIWGSAS